MARKNREREAISVEQEIEARIAAEEGLFPGSVTEERRAEIAREVESLHEATGEARASAEMEKAAESEPTPYFDNFDQALEHFADDVVVTDEYEKLDDKDPLIGKPFIIVKWHFTPSEVGKHGEFVVAKIQTREPLYDANGNARTRFTITDGSEGVYVQLRRVTDKTGKHGGLVARNGLRVSRYEYEGMPAATFYLT